MSNFFLVQIFKTLFNKRFKDTEEHSKVNKLHRYITITSARFFFSVLIWQITLIDFQILNSPCIFGIHPTWQWYTTIFVYCWSIFLFIILLMISPLYSWKVLGCSFLFLLPSSPPFLSVSFLPSFRSFFPLLPLSPTL